MEKTAPEIESKKEYLWGYQEAVRQMQRSEQRIREMRLNRMLPSAVIDGMPHAHRVNDFSGYAAVLEQEERRYMKARYKRLKKCKEIMDRIERLEDEDEKDVLMYRYIKLMKWEDICDTMHLSWRRIHYIHNEALVNLMI